MEVIKAIISIVAVLIRAFGQCWKINSLLTGLLGWWATSALAIEPNLVLLIGAGWVILSSGSSNISELLQGAADEVRRQREREEDA